MAQMVKFQMTGADSYIGAVEIDNDEFMEWSNGIGISQTLALLTQEESSRIFEKYADDNLLEIHRIG